MKCPHCLVEFHDEWSEVYLDKDCKGMWFARHTQCPACEKDTIVLDRRIVDACHEVFTQDTYQVWPKGITRAALPSEVPEDFTADYKEACLVLADSPKASAALSRRCLQHLLRGKAGVTPGNLADEIQQVLDSKDLPSHLAEAIDSVRNIGNFAAHPGKSEKTGEIVEVEPGEAEWSLDTLEALFDFYFVQPARLEAKRDALNKRLEESGQPPMKEPPAE